MNVNSRVVVTKMGNCLDPHSRLYKYWILILICYIRSATFFCIEMVGGLQSNFIKIFMIDDKLYNIMFSAYTWPDFLLSVVGAVIIDRYIGKRIGLMIAVTNLVLGLLVFTTGIFKNSYITLVIGRFIMGLGIGSSMSIENALLSVWFNTKATFAMGVMFSCGRLGAALGLVIPHVVYCFIAKDVIPNSSSNSDQLTLAFMVGLLLLLGVLICSLLVVLLDFKGRSVKSTVAVKKLSVADLKDFSPKFWITGILCNVYYSLFFVFVANGQLFLISKFGFSARMANITNFLIFASPILVTPLMGMLVQAIGYNVYWGIVGTVLAILSHALFNIIDDSYIFLPYLLAIVLALSYSFFGISIFPLPSFIVQEHQLTTAYSLFTLLYCVSFTGISVTAGGIIDSGGYMWFELYSFLLLCFVLAMLILLVVIDSFSKGRKVNRIGTGMPCRGIEAEKLPLMSKDPEEEVTVISLDKSSEFVFGRY